MSVKGKKEESVEKNALVQLNMRVSADIKEKLFAIAADERRTATAEVEYLIDQEWRRREKNIRDK